jgi:hypothetical protein
MKRCDYCKTRLTGNVSLKCDRCYRESIKVKSVELPNGWLEKAIYKVMTNERKNITQPPDWWTVFEAEAKKAGVSLSEWIGEACAERLPVKIRKQLSERPPANRPPKAKD